jgi:hypothetical protein
MLNDFRTKYIRIIQEYNVQNKEWPWSIPELALDV